MKTNLFFQQQEVYFHSMHWLEWRKTPHYLVLCTYRPSLSMKTDGELVTHGKYFRLMSYTFCFLHAYINWFCCPIASCELWLLLEMCSLVAWATVLHGPLTRPNRWKLLPVHTWQDWWCMCEGSPILKGWIAFPGVCPLYRYLHRRWTEGFLTSWDDSELWDIE